MSDKLNVDISYKAEGVEGGDGAFSAEMDIRYRNMGRLGFARFEQAQMQMYADMAKSQAELMESKGNG